MGRGVAQALQWEFSGVQAVMPDTVDPEELKPHPYSTRIFRQRKPSGRFITEFADEQEEPLVIMPRRIIVDGHRRWLAALEAGMDEVEVRIEEYDSLARERRAILHQDDNRNPSFSQQMRLAEEYETEVAPIVKQRIQKGKPLDELDDPLQNLAEGGNVTTRELVADRVGWSGEKLRQAKKVWQAAQRGESWAQDSVKDLDDEEESVNGAFKRKERAERKQKRQALREREDDEVTFVDQVKQEDLPEPESIFPFPGGKSRFAHWIISRMPKHTTYVEVFGGSASILHLKPASRREVYNDLDADMVNFFEVLRDRPEELQTRLQPVDFTKEEYDEWVAEFYNGYRPDDPVKAAAIFFFTRYAQWGGKHEGKSGFNEDAREDYHRKRGRLLDYGNRFADVEIENRNYQDVLAKYDSENTLFYLDPPYVTTEGRFQEGDGFDHAELADQVSKLNGRWIVSYGDEYPDALEDYRMEVQEVARGMASGKPAQERLFMNYPESEQEAFKGGWHGDALQSDW